MNRKCLFARAGLAVLGALLWLAAGVPVARAAGTINVNSSAQRNPPTTNGVCTLGAAILTANTNTLTDGCTLAAGTLTAPYTINVPAGTYTLSAIGDSQAGGNGLPAITSSITLQGASASTTIIERSSAVGTPDFRILLLAITSSSGSVILNDLTFRNGRSTTLSQARGGAVRQAGNTGTDFTVNRCVFDNNSVFDLLDANSSGGAISGTFTIPLVVTDSTFTNNSASSGGGAIDGFTSVSNSTFINNSASAGNINGSGGALRGSSVTVSNSTFLNNSVNGSTGFGGGAISITPSSTATITRSVFMGNSQNSTNGVGGAVIIQGTTQATISENLFMSNTSKTTAGAIWGVFANANISGNTFRGNTSALNGGALFVGAPTKISNSTFSGNTAGTPTTQQSVSGGAILSAGGLTLNNITVTGNTAANVGVGGEGGGILFGNNDVIRNSIVAGNIGHSPDCFVVSGLTVTSQGHNIVGVDCGITAGTGDQFGAAGAAINPMLAGLADNGTTVMAGSNVGGQTPVAIQTHALLPGSPALEMGDLGTADGISPHCEATDQRGITRPKPSGGICDVGAFEDLTGLGISVTADFSITKTGSPGSVNTGQNVTFTITVMNNGPDTAAATLSDVLPPVFVFVSLASPAGWSCTTPSVGATGTVTCTNAGLASGASGVFTLVITAASSGTISNTATVSTPANDLVSGNNSATAMTTVTGGAASADVSVTKSGAPNPINLGTGNITYSLTVSNAGPSSATNVVLTDTLPAGVTFVSATPGAPVCTQASGTVTCNIGTLVSGGMMAFTIVVTPTATGTLTNTASVTATETDPTPANNTATAMTTVNPSADLSVGKTGSPNPVTAGSNLTYTITVNNAGPSAAASVAMSDTLPTGTTFVSLTSPAGWTCATPAVGSAGNVNCTIASLASGVAAQTFTLVVATTAAGNLNNTAMVTTTTSDPVSANNTATTATTVSPGAGTDFTISAPSMVDVQGGSLGSVNITLTAVGGAFNTPVILTGTSALLGPFTFSPNPATIGATSANVTMTFTAGSQAHGFSGPNPGLPYLWLSLLTGAILISSAALAQIQRRLRHAALALGIVVLVLGSQSACLNGARRVLGPVPVTVTATAGNLSHSVTITVNVTK